MSKIIPDHMDMGNKRCTKNWIYSHLLMSKYDANAVQMCGKHGKCRIYSHIYNPYVKMK